jgi:hypothetical protein
MRFDILRRASAYLRADVVQDPNLHAEKVLADGPYRYVRNPLYILVAIGMGLLASRLEFAFIVLGMLVFCLWLIGLEDLTRSPHEKNRKQNLRSARRIRCGSTSQFGSFAGHFSAARGKSKEP